MSVIYEGQLNSKKLYQVRRLTVEDLSKILTLQKHVYEAIENKAQLAQLTKEEYEYILTGKGFILGVFVADELIAIRALLVPKINDPEHLGLDVGLAGEQLKEVIYQEISFVHPKFRGNRLQQTLAKLIMAELGKEDHPYRYVCATVAPFNIPSLLDKFRQGMCVKALKLKYEDQLRYIFLKDLHRDFPIEAIKEKRDLPLTATMQQQQLLAAGWIGLSLEKREDTYVITYVSL